MTDPRLEEIKKRLEAATLKMSYRTSETRDNFEEMSITMDFMENAYKDLSWLLGEVERLNKYVAICKEMAELIDRELGDDRLSSLGFTIAHNLLSDYKEITG